MGYGYRIMRRDWRRYVDVGIDIGSYKEARMNAIRLANLNPEVFYSVVTRDPNYGQGDRMMTHGTFCKTKRFDCKKRSGYDLSFD